MIAMTTRAQIMREIEDFLKDTGMSPTRFGHEAMRDRALMHSLRRGRDLQLATVEKLREFMDKERAKIKKKGRRAETVAAA